MSMRIDVRLLSWVGVPRRGLRGAKTCHTSLQRATAPTTLAAMTCVVLGSAWAPAVRAADLGGDCCAQIEERIAELEETLVRTGNRKVHVTISGRLSHAILAWDDGSERNVYQVMNSNSSDRFRFEGHVKLNKDLEVGYFVELGLSQPSSSNVTQLNDDARSSALETDKSLWFVRSDRLGTLSIGLASAATDDVLAYNLGGTNVAASSDVSSVGGGFFTRDSTVAGAAGLNNLSSGNTMSLRWRRFAPEIGTPSEELIRYDSPVFMGFVASASWGDDDFWDVSLRYAHDGRQFRVAGAIGYYENRAEDDDTFGWPPGGDNEPGNGNSVVREFQASASILHVPTGLFLSGAYLHREFSGSDPGMLTFACFTSSDAAAIRAAGVPCTNRPDFDYFWLNAGIRRKFFSLGYTSIYGEYSRSEDAVTGLNVSVASAVGGDIDYVTESTMEVWGVGIVQHISAAQMDVFFSYRRLSAEVKGLESDGRSVVAPLEDVGLFLAGSRIRF